MNKPATFQHQCDNCGGIDPGSCAMNPESTAPDSEAATALARYLGSHSVSTLQTAFRLLGWELAFELRNIGEYEDE